MTHAHTPLWRGCAIYCLLMYHMRTYAMPHMVISHNDPFTSSLTLLQPHHTQRWEWGKVHTVECQEFVRWMEPLIITGGVSRNWIIVISLALLEYAVSSRLSLPACRLFTNFLFKKRLDAVVVDISDTFHFFEPHYSLLTPHHGVFNLLTSVLQMAKEMAWFPGKSS